MQQIGKIQAKNLQQAGFAIVPDVMDAAVISALTASIEQTSESAGSRQRANERYAIRNLLVAIPAVKMLAESTPIRAIAESILGRDAFVVRGLLFDKTHSANWKVAWHQDLTISVQQKQDVPGYGPWSVKAGVPHVQPPTSVMEEMLTLRLHLDDCEESNGPLQVIPGSHRFGKLSAEDIQKWHARVPAVNCIVKSGGALLMRPLLLHASSPAREPGHRRVVHLEFAACRLPGNLSWDN